VNGPLNNGQIVWVLLALAVIAAVALVYVLVW
jgi:hypothetical protein